MSDKEQSLPAADCARRRLIRGAFGAPAVLTVASGSVAAASNVNCIANIGTFPPVHQGSAPPTSDSIIRIRVYEDQSMTPNLRYVRGQDVPTAYMANAAAGFMTVGQVWRFSVPNNQTVGSPSSTPAASTLVAINRWAALRFDTSGTLVGVGDGGGGQPAGYAVSASCWNSFG